MGRLSESIRSALASRHDMDPGSTMDVVIRAILELASQPSAAAEHTHRIEDTDNRLIVKTFDTYWINRPSAAAESDHIGEANKMVQPAPAAGHDRMRSGESVADAYSRVYDTQALCVHAWTMLQPMNSLLQEKYQDGKMMRWCMKCDAFGG